MSGSWRTWWKGLTYPGGEVRRRARKNNRRLTRHRVEPCVEVLADRVVPSITLSNTQWTPIGPAPISTGSTPPFAAGRIEAAAPDPNNPNVMYVGGDDGGIWETTNWNTSDALGGPVWQPLTDGQPSLNFGGYGYHSLLAPNHPAHPVYGLVSGTGAGVLESINGSPFALLGNNYFEGAALGAIAVTSPTFTNPIPTLYVTVAAGGALGSGVYKSTDGGTTWINTTSGFHNGWAADLVMDPFNSQVLYAGLIANPYDSNLNTSGALTAGVYRSTDGGGHWTLLNNGLPSSFFVGTAIRLEVAPSAQGTVYATVFLGPTVHRYRTTNGGNSWAALSYTPGSDETRFWHVVLAVDPGDANHVFVNDAYSLYESKDGGQTWRRYDRNDNQGGPDFVNMTFDTNDNPVITADQGVYGPGPGASAGGPTTNLDGRIGNLQVTEFYDITLDPHSTDRAYGVAQDLAPTRFTGAGSWNYLGRGGETGKVLADPFNASLLYVSNPLDHANLVSRSTDGGNTWASIFSTNTIQDQDYGLAYAVQKSFAMDPSNSSRLLIGTTQVFETTDAQDPAPTWTPFSPVLSPSSDVSQQYITALAISADGTTTYAATADGHVWVNSPNLFWAEIDSGLYGVSNGHVVDMRVDPTDPNQVYAVTNGGGGKNVWYLRGGRWTNVSGDLPNNVGPNTIAADFRYTVPALFVGTGRGVYRSLDGGQHWIKFSPGLPNAQVNDLEMQSYQGQPAAGGPPTPSNVLAAATYGRGAWEIVVGVTASVVGGTLQIHGDGEGDVITVALDPMNPSLLDVWEGVANNPFDRLVGSFDVTRVTSVSVTVQDTDNTINIEDSVAGVPVTVNLGTGNNTVNISPFAQTLNTIQADVTLNPGGGSVTLNVDDQQARVLLAQYTLTSSSVGRGTGTIFYSGVDTLTLNGGASAVYNVLGTEAFANGTTTTVNTGAGFATVNVQNNDNVNNTLNIVGNGGGGNDVVNLGDNGTVQGILGPVNIENPPSYDHITIHDSADPNALTWFLTTLGANPADSEGNGELWGQVSYSLTNLAINYEYADTSSLTLDTGTGAGSNVKVLATNPVYLACQTSVVSNAPTNVYVGYSAQKIDVQGIGSTLDLEPPPSGDTIYVDDSVDPQARTATLSTLASNPADSEHNTHRWGQISGLAPGNINYEFGDVGRLTLDGSAGGTTFDVSAVPNVSLVLDGVGGTNTLNGPNQVNAWTLNRKNAGVLDGNITFRPAPLGDGFQDLGGGSVSDTFTLSSLVPVAMNLLLNSPGQLSNPSGSQTLTGAVNNNGHLLTVAGAGSTTLRGVISGPGGLSMQGTGTATLAAADTYGGGSTVASGTLVAEHDGALGAANTATVVDAGATLALAGGTTYATPENLFLNGAGKGGAGALESLGGAANTFAGPVTLQSASTINAPNTPLTLTGLLQEGTFLLTVTGGDNTTIQGVISGSGGLSKQGSATLTLAAVNSYTGNTTIVTGLLVVTQNAALGGANTSTVVDVGAVLALSGGVNYTTVENVTLNGSPAGVCLLNLSGSNTFQGPITLQAPSGISSSAGSLTLTGAVNEGVNALAVSGPGNVTLKGAISGSGGLSVQGNGTVTLAAANPYTGNTTVGSGTVIVTKDGALGASGTRTTVDAGATLALAGNVTYATAENLFLNGTGSGGAGALENLGGANGFAGPIALQSPSTIAAHAGALTLTGNLSAGAYLLTVSGSGSVTARGTISGTAGLSTTAAKLYLDAANGYSGQTKVAGGSLYVEANGALGGSTTTVDSGASLILAGVTYTLPAPLTLHGGRLESENILGPSDTFASPITLTAPSALAAALGTSLTVNGAIANGGHLLTAAGPGGVVLGGVISGSGGLDQLTGTLTLSANNTYTGPTTTKGTLVVNGAQPSSAISVNAGGLLAGTGSVGAVTVNGGTVAPGPPGGVGTLTAASADFSNGGTLLIRVPAYGTPGVKYGQLRVTGNLTLGGTSALTLDLNGLGTAGTASGIAVYGSVKGTFSTVKLLNNPKNRKVTLHYGATGLDAVFS
jgi:autotransporter-associated beta strand protein